MKIQKCALFGGVRGKPCTNTGYSREIRGISDPHWICQQGSCQHRPGDEELGADCEGRPFAKALGRAGADPRGRNENVTCAYECVLSRARFTAGQ